MEVLELLVQNGADLNAKTKHDETPAGKRPFIFLLIEAAMKMKII